MIDEMVSISSSMTIRAASPLRALDLGSRLYALKVENDRFPTTNRHADLDRPVGPGGRRRLFADFIQTDCPSPDPPGASNSCQDENPATAGECLRDPCHFWS
jgi:hypothetical protein